MLIASNFALFSIFLQLLKFNAFMHFMTFFIGAGIKSKIRETRHKISRYGNIDG